jgi:DNA-binding LacI/PurR family transcriptional regulator
MAGGVDPLLAIGDELLIEWTGGLGAGAPHPLDAALDGRMDLLPRGPHTAAGGSGTRRVQIEAHDRAEAGCPLDEELIAYREERVYAGGHAGVRELWQQCPRPPTALLCSNDQVAIGAMRAFQELGVRVPEEVALVGFDDLPEGAFARVPLTTLAQPLEEQARQAVALLFDRIEQPDRREEVTSVALPPRLLVRESCGARLGVTREP